MSHEACVHVVPWLSLTTVGPMRARYGHCHGAGIARGSPDSPDAGRKRVSHLQPPPSQAEAERALYLRTFTAC